MRFFKELYHWLRGTKDCARTLGARPEPYAEISMEQLSQIMSQLSGEPQPASLPSTILKTTSPPAKQPDADAGKPTTTLEVLGMAAPIEQPTSDSLTPEEAKALDKLSKQLQYRLLMAQDLFMSEHPKLTYTQKNFIVLDAAAAMAAEWSCSEESARSSNMNIPSAMMSTVELFQYNFMQKQKAYHARFGTYVH